MANTFEQTRKSKNQSILGTPGFVSVVVFLFEMWKNIVFIFHQNFDKRTNFKTFVKYYTV